MMPKLIREFAKLTSRDELLSAAESMLASLRSAILLLLGAPMSKARKGIGAWVTIVIIAVIIVAGIVLIYFIVINPGGSTTTTYP